MKHFWKCLISFLIIVCLFSNASTFAAPQRNAPILILGSPGHFDSYTGEILKAEGFNEFQISSLTSPNFSLKYLRKFDLVILTEVPLTNQQRTTLTQIVKEGGNLVAFKPEKELAPVFGLEEKPESLKDAYLAIHASPHITNGLISTTLQFHGTADLYTFQSGKTIASLYKTPNDSTNYPAVVVNKYGIGHAIAFVYNLPQSIAYTRQGNPDFAGVEKDGIKGIRAMDLFTEGWVDTSKNILNRADEQMRLLSHCIEYLAVFKKPLPAFWYFPDTLKCLVTLTNDGEYRAEEDFEPQFSDIESKGAKMVLYILSTEKVSKKATNRWQQKGHEISGHPDDTREAEHPTWEGMNKAISTKLAELKSRFDISMMHTIVNHWFVWCGNKADGTRDFTAQAKIEADYGIGMVINYAHYDNNSNQPRFLGSMGYTQGNFTGSGLPMKFATANGGTINIYQHLNNVYDQQYMENKDSTGYYNCFKGIMDRSLYNEVYSYISIKAHNDEYFFSKTPLGDMLTYAKQHNIPVWTPVKLLSFLKAKDEAGFTDINWSKDGLSFNIKSTLVHPNKLTFRVPYFFSHRKIIEIKIDGVKQNYSIKRVKGYDYAFISIDAGKSYAVAVKYSN